MYFKVSIRQGVRYCGLYLPWNLGIKWYGLNGTGKGERVIVYDRERYCS